MKALHAFLYRCKLLWWWLPDSPFLWAAETYGLRTIQTVRMLHISGNSKWRYHRRVWAKQRDVTDIWLSQLMCDSGKTGWLQKCAVLKYSGCVLRSSRVLFGSLLQEDIFLHFFFFFFWQTREWNYRENRMFPYTNSHVWTHRMLRTCLLVVSRIRGMKWYTTCALLCCFLVVLFQKNEEFRIPASWRFTVHPPYKDERSGLHRQTMVWQL